MNALNFVTNLKQYINCGTNASLNPNRSNFSIEMWIKSSVAQTGADGIMTKNYASGYGVFQTSKTVIGLYIQSGGSANNITITVDQWIHIGWTVDNVSHTQRSFLNGVFKNQTTNAVGDVTNANDLCFGKYNPGNSGYWSGQIKEVRIYNRLLSDAEMTQHANGIFLDETNLAAHWAMDEGTGSTIADTSGNGNTGTFGAGTTAPTWVVTPPFTRGIGSITGLSTITF